MNAVNDDRLAAYLGSKHSALGLLLFWFGSGPVRGFAVTMALGIVISMFTAVSVVKVIMLAIARRRRLKTASALGIGVRTLGMKLKRWKETGEFVEAGA